MNFNFTKLIADIEAEIQPLYVGGAINWADENRGGAWSHAIEKFERALNRFLEGGSSRELQDSADLYKRTLLDLLKDYKKTDQHKDDAQLFLEGL